MKTLYLEQPKGQQTLHFFLIVIFLAQGVMSLMKIDDRFSLILAILQISLAAFYGLYYFSVLKPRKSRFTPHIKLNENEISFFKGLFYKPKMIQHEEIKIVQIKPERVSVITNDFDFAYHFDYEATNKSEIQHTIESYCLENNIPYEKISYRNV